MAIKQSSHSPLLKSESIDRRSTFRKLRPSSIFKHPAIKALERINNGCLRVSIAGGASRFFGDQDSDLRAHWRINRSDCLSRIMLGGSRALGESFMDGSWEEANGDLVSLLGIILANNLDGQINSSYWRRLCFALKRFSHLPALPIAANCVRRHYDLGNQFFNLMLGDSMTYSCGYLLSKDDSLEQMQQQKHALIARKLMLKRGGSLLDIGCGWGSMLRHCAKKFPHVRAEGITLSNEQKKFADKQMRAENLADRVKIILRDYREHDGQYDFLVSIGMFEHVGKPFYSKFMGRLKRFLKPNGVGLLHTIGESYPGENTTDAWTEEYVFPGYRLPKLQEIVSELQQQDLLVCHVENLKPHYAETLKRWKQNINKHKAEFSKLGPQFDNRFERMWDYYLQSSEAGFRHGSLQLYQLLFCHAGEWPFEHQIVPASS